MDNKLIVIFIIVAVVLFVCVNSKDTEGLSGYGVVSGLSFNNRTSYCEPGNPEMGWSGGCFIPHRVIV